jgi:uncharacterized protein with GYD domain
MLFITLARFRKKPTKETLTEIQRLLEEVGKEGGKILGVYWTLGRYDAVLLSECPNEKTHMRAAIRFADLVSTESLVAVPAEEAIKLVK